MNRLKFGRRRSSGNVLDTQDKPAESSFRVIERSEVQSGKNSAFTHQGKQSRSHNASPIDTRPRSSPLQASNARGNAQDSRNLRIHDANGENMTSHPKSWTRGSANTFNSTSTNEYTQGTRNSYASTDPSSLESIPHYHQPIAAPPTSSPADEAPRKQSFSIKSAAQRTFSFGRAKSSRPASPDHNEPLPDLPGKTRDRAMTESSHTSTVVPPKLDLGNDLDFSSSFGADMFGKRKSTIWEESTNAGRSVSFVCYVTSAPTFDAETSLQESDSALLTKAQIDASNNPDKNVVGSPNSWGSDGSEERLMSFSRSADAANGPSGSFLDADAALLAINAVSAGRFLNDDDSHSKGVSNRARQAQDHTYAQPRESSPYSRTVPKAPPTHLFPGRELTVKSSRTDLHASSDVDSELLFDPTKSAALSKLKAVRPPMHKPQPSKVMTPAEFAEYKMKKENGLTDEGEDAEQDGSDEEVDYDDDDQLERDRQAAKQRRRQEAKLVVYRQTMMKVTGEQPSDLPTGLPKAGRPAFDRMSQSTPNLFKHSSVDLSLQANKPPSDDDDDDDVPLGVLQAHGFPSKTRPPSRVPGHESSASRPGTQMSSYPSPAGATRNEPSAGGGGRLPAFARNLPTDPYLGASLVNQPNRESFALGGGQRHQPQQHSGSMPPGGLINVIAGEERARAMRRGSPNARGTYDTLPGAPTGFQQPPMPPPLMTPTEQSQMQTASQMAQMTQAMQMQMQWMQQMMQMQGMQVPPNFQLQMPQLSHPQQQTGFLQPNAGMGQQRPTSSGSQHTRGMSMMSQNGLGMGLNQSRLNVPGSSQSVYGMQGGNHGYAPSIAASERSNIGQPSRYRPVSIAGVDTGRSQTMSNATATAYQASQVSRPQSRMTMASMSGANPNSKRTTVRAVERSKKPAHDSDDEDDEAWAAMKRQKEAKKSAWRSKKSISATGGAQSMEGGMEGLYYEA